MNVKTIGTGGLSGKSRSFCTLIDNKILVDCGNGIVKTLNEQNVEIEKIKYLLITHMHGDHFFDIPFFIIQRDIIKASNSLKIICPKGGKNIIRQLIALSFIDMYFSEEEYNSLLKRTNTIIEEFDDIRDSIEDDDYKISKLSVKHGTLDNCFAYIIYDNNIKIGVSGDSSYCASIDKMMETVDIGILDISNEKGDTWHMGLDDINQIMQKHKKTIITNHMSESVRIKLINYCEKKLIVPNDGNEYHF